MPVPLLCFSDMGLYCFCVVLYFTRTDPPGLLSYALPLPFHFLLCFWDVADCVWLRVTPVPCPRVTLATPFPSR